MSMPGGNLPNHCIFSDIIHELKEINSLIINFASTFMRRFARIEPQIMRACGTYSRKGGIVTKQINSEPITLRLKSEK